MNLIECDNRFVEPVYRGRGVPVNGMVQVHVSSGEDGSMTFMMLSEEEWKARLLLRCKHGLFGFACKPCLQSDAGIPVTERSSRPIWGGPKMIDQSTQMGAKEYAEHLTSKDGIQRTVSNHKNQWLIRREQ